MLINQSTMIYLDNNATTKASENSTKAMLSCMENCYYNSSSLTSSILGSDKPRNEAANAIAEIINAEDQDCIYFTSGATESNNWIFNAISQNYTSGKIIISAVEHSSVSEPAAFLARRGFKVVEIPVDNRGVILLDKLAENLCNDTVLISIMLANNETGVIQPLSAIGKLVSSLSPGALLHSDATQAIGKMTVDVQNELQYVDLLSFSAHKFHGPKGIGGLYIRPGVELQPFIRGGGQESGLRAGTTNTPALAGLATACAEINNSDMIRMKELRDSFEQCLLQKIQSAIIYAQNCERLPNTSCVSFPGHIGEDIVLKLAENGIIVGIGSACSNGSVHPPKTLLAMGVEYSLASSSIRISLSRYTTAEDIIETVRSLKMILCIDM